MEALTVQQRHLQLPESCLFAPTELQIGATLSQDDFSRLGKALCAVDCASDLWACDYALAGQERWGDEGLQLAKAATKLTVGYLRRCAVIAERFSPSRRFPNLTREHYRGLCCFPVEFTDEWLPTVADKGFGAKTLRALAVEAFGSDPKLGYTKTCSQRVISIRTALYARFQECSPTPKVTIYIEEVLEDWLRAMTIESQARVAAAVGMRGEIQHQQLRAMRNAAKAERLAQKLAKKQRRQEKREAEKLAARAEREQAAQRKAEKLAEQQRLMREARDQKQAEHEAAAERATGYKKRAKQNAATIRGIKPFYGACLSASKYSDMEEAAAAAEKYTAAKGYDFEGYKCEKCSRFHIRVDEAKYEAKRLAALAAREPRPTYAERRAAQKADVL